MESMVDSAPQLVQDVIMDYNEFGDEFPDEAGHLFDEPLMRGHTDIRSHLEDLAQRHPEFADHLRYPAWSSDNRSNTWGRKRRGSEQHDSGEASKQQQQENSQPEQSEEPEPLRGRAKENLRNTVPDMGQKQQQETEEKESRGQRSWSAPPDNRTQQQEKPRFISKIEIHPVNPHAGQPGDATKPPMAPPKPQPQPQPQQQQSPPQPKLSNVRHIPIFVEGRDEPVLSKNIEPEFTQSQAPPQQHFSRPPPQPQYTASHHHFQPQTPPKKQQTPPRYEQQQTPPRYEQQPPQSKTEPPPPQQPEQQPEPPPVNPRDPLYKVDCVQKEVDELKARVEDFGGNSRSDKEYVILDELLTRNLIKLDDIETEGKEEVRAARKNTIKSIQRCISILENKVPMPGSEKKGEAMEVELQPSEVRVGDNVQGVTSSDQFMTLEARTEEANDTSEQSSGDKQMEVESQTPKETNVPGANEVPLTKKNDVTSEGNNAASLNNAFENKMA